MDNCISYKAIEKLSENNTPYAVISKLLELWEFLGLVNRTYFKEKIESFVIGSRKQAAISVRIDEEDGPVAAEIVDLLDGYVWYYAHPDKITDETHYVCTIVCRVIPLF